jgi:prepilin-type N-terminal cleavage/methylation domain-containing protein
VYMPRKFFVSSAPIHGFTLIELLVVISIISLLSSVILAALNTARLKGADASIKANLITVRTQSTLYYDTNNNYGTLASADAGNCSTAGSLFASDTTIAKVIAAITAAGVTPVCNQNTQATGGAWLIYAPLKTAGTVGWCVDSTGVSKSESTAIAGGATYAC